MRGFSPVLWVEAWLRKKNERQNFPMNSTEQWRNTPFAFRFPFWNSQMVSLGDPIKKRWYYTRSWVLLPLVWTEGPVSWLQVYKEQIPGRIYCQSSLWENSFLCRTSVCYNPFCRLNLHLSAPGAQGDSFVSKLPSDIVRVPLQYFIDKKRKIRTRINGQEQVNAANVIKKEFAGSSTITHGMG
jgi:hypothetical protein